MSYSTLVFVHYSVICSINELHMNAAGTTPVNMLAVKGHLPDKGFMRGLQLPLPAQRPLRLPLTFRAATVAVAVAFEVAVAVAVNPR